MTGTVGASGTTFRWPTFRGSLTGCGIFVIVGDYPSFFDMQTPMIMAGGPVSSVLMGTDLVLCGCRGEWFRNSCPRGASSGLAASVQQLGAVAAIMARRGRRAETPKRESGT